MAVSREDEFRTDVARVVQVIRQHLPARYVPREMNPLIASVRRLARLLDLGASPEQVRDAAVATVDAYEWPCPTTASGDDGPDVDPSVLAAVERLRAVVEAMDAEADE